MLTRTAGSSGRRGLPAARLFGPATKACRTRFLLAGNLAPVAATGAADDDAEDIPNWRLPIFGDKIGRVPAFLVPELTAMAKELPGTDLDRRIYYERVHALLAVAGAARSANPAGFNLDEPPSDAEREFGSVLGQAFHQGCSLADVSFAARLPSERVVAIGMRTIRPTGWLERL